MKKNKANEIEQVRTTLRRIFEVSTETMAFDVFEQLFVAHGRDLDQYLAAWNCIGDDLRAIGFPELAEMARILPDAIAANIEKTMPQTQH